MNKLFSKSLACSCVGSLFVAGCSDITRKFPSKSEAQQACDEFVTFNGTVKVQQFDSNLNRSVKSIPNGYCKEDTETRQILGYQYLDIGEITPSLVYESWQPGAIAKVKWRYKY